MSDIKDNEIREKYNDLDTNLALVFRIRKPARGKEYTGKYQ